MIEEIILSSIIFLLALTIKNTRDIGVLCGRLKNK